MSLRDVREFHRAFGVPSERRPRIPRERALLRLKLLREELAEVEEAVNRGDTTNTLHELADLQYVLDGTFLEFGLAHLKAKAVAEVHRANMSKLGADGRPVLRDDGKVLKGPGFKPADMRPLFKTGR